MKIRELTRVLEILLFLNYGRLSAQHYDKQFDLYGNDNHWLITLIRDNITFTPTDIPSTINTHNIKLQMFKVHLNNTKHITIANVYIHLRDSTSTHYKTADKDIQHCIQHITTIPHSVLTGVLTLHSGTRTLMTTEDN